MKTLTSTKPIQASSQRVTVEGNVFYTDKRRRIDLKKPIRDLFQHTYNPIGYKMEVCICPTSTIDRCKELLSKNVRPVLMYFEEIENEMS